MSDDYDSLLAFPFAPDLSQPIVETFGYLTDVIVSGNGTEQRVQLREIPTGSINVRILALERAEAQLLNAVIHGHLTGPFAVGRWQFATPLTSDAEAGDSAIYCDTDNLPFEAGAYLLLWADPLHVELATVDGVFSGVIQLAAVLENDWPAGRTYVIPAVAGRLSTSESLTWESLIACSQDVTFDVDGFTP